MNKFSNVVVAITMVLGVSVGACAETHAYLEEPDPSWDPVDSEVHMAYEWATFNPAAPAEHGPGAVLSGPGDMYRYTVLRDDKYAGNPEYEVVRALLGVHIDASKPDNPGKKWGRITINGTAYPYVVKSKKDTRQPKATDFVAIISDAELTGSPGSSTPPFIYDVTELIARGENVTVEITNLREDGAVNGTAPFGGFIVNRIGAHVWYKKK